MRCPHCSVNLLRKQRTGYRCSSCRRLFALDPKIEGLNDRRLASIAERLSDRARYYYTATQLAYALDRRWIRLQISSRDRPPERTNPLVSVLLLAVSVGVCVLGVTDEPVAFAGAALFGLLAVFAYLGWRHPQPRDRRVATSTKVENVERTIVARWSHTYGSGPTGLIRPHWLLPAFTVCEPVAVLLCRDSSVHACLRANAVPQRLRINLAITTADVPAEVPVILLHDVSPTDLRWAAEQRARLPGRRVFDATPSVRTVRTSATAVRLCEPADAREPATFADIAAAGDTSDLGWLAEGWWSPIAALTPQALIGRVERAVRRVEPGADIGFMSWPDGSPGVSG